MEKRKIDLTSMYVQRSDYCSIFEQDSLECATISVNQEKVSIIIDALKEVEAKTGCQQACIVVGNDVASFQFEGEPTYHYKDGDFCRVCSDSSLWISSASRHDDGDFINIQIGLSELLDLPKI